MANLTFSPSALTPKNNVGDVYVFTATATVEKTYAVYVPTFAEIKLTADSLYSSSVLTSINSTPVSFSIRIISNNIVDGVVQFMNMTDTPHTSEFLPILFDIKNLLIVRLGEGYGDYYRKGINIAFNSYAQDDTVSVPNAYVYNEPTATFRSWNGTDVVPKYKLTARNTKIQVYSKLFDADMTTPDIQFDNAAIKGSAIEFFIKSNVSLASLKTSWVVDSKTIFTDGPVNKMGDVARTGSFLNSEVRFDGSQATVETKIHPDVRPSTALKIKIQAILQGSGLDDVVINSIRILPSNIISVGGIDG
ncbi:MAG TPA: hypothetical protein PLZ43_14905 [bacterium]|nr:hypothetical protein [bacterium]